MNNLICVQVPAMIRKIAPKGSLAIHEEVRAWRG